MATEPVALHRDLNTEALEVDDNSEDQNGWNEIHDVGKAFSPKGFTQCTSLVLPSEQEMEKSDYGTLKFGATSDVNRRWGECFPNDGFANIRSDEQVDSGTETVALLKEFIKQNDDKSGHNELNDEKKADTRS